MTIDELFRYHAARSLSQYGGSLHFMMEFIENHEVPDETNQSIRPLAEQLKRHLAKAGAAEDDDFLLRFGLTVAGQFPGFRPQSSVPFADWSSFSAERLGEASTQISRLREVLNAGRRLIPALSPNTLDALRELWAIIGTSSLSDEEWVGAHAQLSAQDVNTLGARAFTCLEDDQKVVEEVGTGVLGALANYRKEGLGLMAAKLVDEETF